MIAIASAVLRLILSWFEVEFEIMAFDVFFSVSCTIQCIISDGFCLFMIEGNEWMGGLEEASRRYYDTLYCTLLA